MERIGVEVAIARPSDRMEREGTCRAFGARGEQQSIFDFAWSEDSSFSVASVGATRFYFGA
jgi:hypothetical protein